MEKSSGEKKKKKGTGDKSKSKTRAASKKPASAKDEVSSSAGDQESIAGFQGAEDNLIADGLP